jgi:hypothetical protein
LFVSELFNHVYRAKLSVDALLWEQRLQMEKATSVCLLQTENGNGKLQFVCCKWKRKNRKFVFLWLANDNQKSTIYVTANMPLYADILQKVHYPAVA